VRAPERAFAVVRTPTPTSSFDGMAREPEPPAIGRAEPALSLSLLHRPERRLKVLGQAFSHTRAAAASGGPWPTATSSACT
jgi:hypothetical protein